MWQRRFESPATNEVSHQPVDRGEEKQTPSGTDVPEIKRATLLPFSGFRNVSFPKQRKRFRIENFHISDSAN